MELPASFYYITGFLILTNIGSIGALLMVAFRAVWWASKIDSKVDAAHRRIDEIKAEQ